MLVLPPEQVHAIIEGLRAARIEPLPLAVLPVHCRDPKDDMVLACALGAQAAYLVTGDADLLALDGDPALGRLRIVTPRQFLALFAPGKRSRVYESERLSPGGPRLAYRGGSRR